MYEGQRQLLGPNHVETIETMNGLAWLQYRRGAYADALFLHPEVAEQLELLGVFAATPEGQSSKREVVKSLERLYETWGRRSDAEQWRMKAGRPTP